MLERGQFADEYAFVSNQRFPHKCIARERSTVLQLHKDVFWLVADNLGQRDILTANFETIKGEQVHDRVKRRFQSITRKINLQKESVGEPCYLPYARPTWPPCQSHAHPHLSLCARFCSPLTSKDWPLQTVVAESKPMEALAQMLKDLLREVAKIDELRSSVVEAGCGEGDETPT